nr:retrovirus-related Pol polyprotein from transposon TNT 1-94 [Tanacetum cinerariifolium]
MASDHISSDPAPECQGMALKHDSLSPRIQCQENVPHVDKTITTSNELDLLFSPMFDELLNGSSQVLLKSSAGTSADSPNHRQQQQTTPLINQQTPEQSCQVPTQAPTVTSTENINQAETNSETDQVANDEFIKIFYTSIQDRGVTSSRHGNDLLIGSHGTNLYSITLQGTTSPNLICFIAKASSSQAWLWHRRLSHLNFDTINLLSKNDIMVGLPKLKFIKDHLCSSCELGKAKRKSFHTKISPSLKRWLQLLHMDLCGPMRVASINGKRYVLVIVDDYSRYTWTHLLRSKDETPEVLIDFLRLVQRGLHAQVRIIQIDKGTEFLNQSLHAYFATEGILYQMPVARTPEKTVLSKDEIVLLDDENLDKMKEKDHISSDPAPECQGMALEHDSLSPKIQCQENVPHVDKTVTTSNELDLLFSLMFDELLNGSSQVVLKSSAGTSADSPNHYQQQQTTPLINQQTPEQSCEVPTQAPTVTSTENINQAETNSETDQVANDEFIKIFCTSIQDRGVTSSRHVDSSNMHTLYQQYPSEHRWMKDHPLEQVIGNLSQSVRTRCQLESDGEMCMFALTVSQTEPKNIKEAMADYAWIESIQEELHRFD